MFALETLSANFICHAVHSWASTVQLLLGYNLQDGLVREDPLEKEMAIHSSILAWETPWTEGPGGPQSGSLLRDGYNLATEQRQGPGYSFPSNQAVLNDWWCESLEVSTQSSSVATTTYKDSTPLFSAEQQNLNTLTRFSCYGGWTFLNVNWGRMQSNDIGHCECRTEELTALLQFGRRLRAKHFQTCRCQFSDKGLDLSHGSESQNPNRWVTWELPEVCFLCLWVCFYFVSKFICIFDYIRLHLVHL